MIKKTISYEDYNGNELTEDFYFNLTKLEIIEMEIDFEGGLSNHIEKLTETTAGAEAYHLFKDIILKAYGEKSEDGKRFVKTNANGRPLSEEFETSPALAELIFGFLKDGNDAAEFVRGVLPAKIVAEVEAETAKNKTTVGGELTSVSPEPVTLEKTKRAEEHSREELLAMTQAEFDAVAGTDPQKMHPDVLRVAFQRKSSGQ